MRSPKLLIADRAHPVNHTHPVGPHASLTTVFPPDHTTPRSLGMAQMGAEVVGSAPGWSTQRIVESLSSLRQQAQLVKHSLQLLTRFEGEIHSAVVTQEKVFWFDSTDSTHLPNKLTGEG